jgi:hydroxymethylbilane synthase
VTALRLGSRGSQLALFQARLVAQRIVESGGPESEIIIIRTSGDQLADRPLSEIGGKRLFVKEIEDALLRNEIDIAVHSSKDMPAELPEGLTVAAVLPREDPADAIVLPAGRPLVHAPRVGTGSVRRIAQLAPLFPGARFKNIRGNLDTRLRKLDDGDFDALVLAAAGLRRLGFESRISTRVPLEDCIPAPGQGIIAIETRAGDVTARAAAARVNDDDAFCALEAERALVSALSGGCQMPIGAVAMAHGAAALELQAVVASLDGSRAIRYKKVGDRHDAAALGRAVAEELLKSGAEEILREARNAGP